MHEGASFELQTIFKNWQKSIRCCTWIKFWILVEIVSEFYKSPFKTDTHYGTTAVSSNSKKISTSAKNNCAHIRTYTLIFPKATITFVWRTAVRISKRHARKRFFRQSIVVAPERPPGVSYFTVASQNSRHGSSEIMHVLRLFMRTSGKQWCCQYGGWIVVVTSETENLLVRQKGKRKWKRGEYEGRGRRRRRRRRRGRR